jgi:cell division cycle 14
LYYTAVAATPVPNPQRHYFTIDTERGFQYWNFFLDYGPLNLGQLYRFCALMNQKLSQPKLRDKIIIFYSSSHPNRRANAAFLISAWSMLCLNRSPEDAFRPFRPTALSFPPWVRIHYHYHYHYYYYQCISIKI